MHNLKRWTVWLAAGAAVACLTGCGEGEQRPARSLEGKTLELFVGSASQPATEEAAKAFERKTGCKVLLHLGGSGKMLTSMLLGRRGDLYFPGSSDFMEKAKKLGEVLPETERIVVYLLPAINTPADNPKNIETLEDLARPGVRIGIAVPDTVCVGLYAVEVLVKNGLAEKVKPNIVTYAESCAKIAQIVALGQTDAVLGWRVFHYWKPELVKTIPLKPAQVPRIGTIPIAISKYCKQPEVAQAFIAFLLSDEGKAVFRKWHYLTSVEEARALALPDTPIGGEWQLPEGW